MPIGTINPAFDFYNNKGEQQLLESLIVEACQIYGVPCIYIARTFNNLDNLYGTDDTSSYTYYWPLAMYPKNVLGFTGDREFLSKVAGMEIRDQIIFSIPRYTFDQVVASDANFPALPNNIPQPANRPREGDLIWFPFQGGKCFKIMYVNITDMFFQLGKIYTWEVTVELFEYSGEQFNTGITEIDRIQVRGDLNYLSYLVLDTDNTTPILLDQSQDWWLTDAYSIPAIQPTQDNQNIDTEANTYIDWAGNIDPFASGNSSGVF